MENHGLLIIKDGETVFEEYAYPYSKDMPHTLFSVTKSIVSTATGFAIAEGLISLDTKIKDIFPEYEKCKGDEWEKLTLRSVLTMQSNKEFSFLQDMTGNYVEMFMKAPFRKKGGFLYSNNDAHIVAAVVEKVTGQGLVDYLMPRLFEPLGIDRPFWETNSIGECIGGTGCYLKLQDLAKIMLCYSQCGKYNGEQVIPEFWTKEATKIQVDFGNGNGYGYFFWINGDVFSMTGMFGQIVTYSKKHNAIIASMNCGVDEDSHTRLLQNTLIKALNYEDDEDSRALLSEYLEKRNKSLPICENLPLVSAGKKLYLTKCSDLFAKIMIFPQSIIPRTITCSLAKRPKSNPDEVSFELNENILTVRWLEEEDEIIINCGLDGVPRFSECEIKGYPYKIWAYAYTENGKVKAVVKPLNTLATQYITFDFSKDSVKMQFKGTPDFTEFILKNASSPDFFKKHPTICKIAMSVISVPLKIAEKPMKFKIKNKEI